MAENKSAESRIIFGAVYQGNSESDYVEYPVYSRKVIPLAYEFYLYDYNIFIRNKISAFLVNISTEIVKRTPRPSFQMILDTHNYIEDDLHLQKNTRTAQEIKKYQAYTYSPVTSLLTYILLTNRNYGDYSSVYRLFLQLDRAFLERYPELGLKFRLSKETKLCPFPELREKIQTCQNHRQIDKIAEVRSEVDEVKEIIIKNIEEILEQGEKLEDLVYKTDEIAFGSVKFRQTATKLNSCCVIL